MKDAKTQIEAQMQLYFDGLYYSDIARLGKVFDPAARYVCATESPVLNLGMDQYLPIVAKRPAPATRNEPRRDRIASITLAGPNTALVIAHCAIGERHFTDFLNFIRTVDGWRIIAKVFHYDIVAPAATAKD